MTLATPTKTAEIIRKYSLRLDKAFGQNFLIDANILRKIIDASHLKKTDNVLEVGPGIGTLGLEVAPKVNSLTLVELDKRLIPALKDTLKKLSNIKIIQRDALKLNYSNLKPAPNKLVSNLPYNIASPLLIKLLRECPTIKEFTVMIQKEVADRLTASPGTKEFGALTLKIKFFADVKKLFPVSKNVFMPKPKINSTVIKINRKVVGVNKKTDFLFELIEQAFRYRRKTIKNSLLYWEYDEQTISKALAEAGIDPQVRAEQVDLEGYKAIAQALGY